MKNVLIILSLPLILATCKKNSDSAQLTCTEANTIMAPQLAKDLFAFKPGTWWVYEDLNNHTFDSLWVGENTSEKRYYNNSSMGTEFSFCAEVNNTKIYNKDYNMTTSSKFNTSYIELTNAPLYNGALGSGNYRIGVISNNPKNFRNSNFDFTAGKLNEDKNTSQGMDILELDSNYLFNNFSSNIALVHFVKVYDSLKFNYVQIKNIGLYKFYWASENINIILRRYNIVQ